MGNEMNEDVNNDVKNKEGRKHENVMLLTMSTLNGPYINYYQADYSDNETVCFEGISQLEPGTKYVLRMLEKQGEKLDRMIVVCTPETTELAKEKDKSGQYPRAYNIDIRKNEGGEEKVLYGNEKPMPALDFYKKRINDFITGKEEAWRSPQNPSILIDRGHNFGYTFSIKDYKLDKEKEIFDIVPKLCTEISNGKAMEDIHLFVDMQGGSRSYASVISDVLSLLKMRGLTHVRYFAVDFEREQQVHPIREVTKENLVADLIAAFDVFRDSGRADDLKRYYKNYRKVVRREIKQADGEAGKEVKQADGEAEEEVIQAIGEVADAVMLCAVGRMKQAAGKLKKTIEEYEEKDDSKKDILFKILIRDIKTDYAAIFESDADLFKDIEWCLKKKMYQQALTLLESKFPGKLFADCVLEIDLLENGNAPRTVHRTGINAEKIEEYYKEKENEWKQTEEERRARANRPEDFRPTRKYWQFNYPYYDIVSYISVRLSNPDRDRSFHFSDISDNGDGYSCKCEFLPRQANSSNSRAEGVLKLNITVEQFKGILKNYQKITDLRNNINHANSDQITAGMVEKQLTTFMENYNEGIK